MEDQPMGVRIREYRTFKGLKQIDFAARADLKQTTLSSIEGGTSEPSATVIQKILNAFPDLNPGWLLMGRGSMQIERLPASVEGIADQLNLLTMKYQMQAGKIEAQDRELAGKDKIIRALEDQLGKSSGNLDQPRTDGPTPGPIGFMLSVQRRVSDKGAATVTR